MPIAESIGELSGLVDEKAKSNTSVYLGYQPQPTLEKAHQITQLQRFSQVFIVVTQREIAVIDKCQELGSAAKLPSFSL
ncbi:hypothetical protein OH492_13450 [Vibrio chagasii]|nr:hypothetical protein [Vibrio chagasii]